MKSANQDKEEAAETSGEQASGGSGVLDEYGPIPSYLNKRANIPKPEPGKTSKTSKASKTSKTSTEKEAHKALDAKQKKREEKPITTNATEEKDLKSKTGTIAQPHSTASKGKVEHKKTPHLPRKSATLTSHADAGGTAKVDKKYEKILGAKVACRLMGKKSFKMGELKWVGNLPSLPRDAAHLIAGVELSRDDKMGTDGTYRGVRYFKSTPKRGYFFRLADCKVLKH